jgi:hypothetical protein
MRRVVVMLLLVGCSAGGSSGDSTTPLAATITSAPTATSAPTIDAPKPIPDRPTSKTSICEDVLFWNAFIKDAESGLYDQGDVNDELRAFLPKLQQDVLAAGGATTQAALDELVPAGTSVLADKVGSSGWRLDLAFFALDLKSVLKYLPNCQ